MIDYILYLCSLGIPLAVMAQATDLLAGHCGRVGVGATLFAAIGGYTYALLTTHIGISVWPSMAASIVIVYTFARIFSFVMTKNSRDRYLLATVALQLAFLEIVNNWNAFGASLGLRNIPGPGRSFHSIDSTLSSLIVSVPLLAISTLLVILLFHQKSRLGRLLHWIRDDQLSAQAFAVPCETLLVNTFCLHAVLSGVAGISIVIGQAYLSPESFSLAMSIQVLTVVYLSGTGSNPFAMLVGTCALISIAEFTYSLPIRPDFVGPLQQIIINAMLVLVLALRRRGLSGPVIDAGPSAARLE